MATDSLAENAEQQALLDKFLASPPFHLRQAIRRARGDSFPRFLYKYASFNPSDHFSIRKATDIVVNEVLWLSTPTDFNDPYDFRARFIADSDRAKLRKHFELAARQRVPSSIKGHKKEREKLVRRAIDRTIADGEAPQKAADRNAENVGVCCFSANARSILMWSHYAQSHTGLCYQFDPSKSIDIFFRCLKVNYATSPAVIRYPTDLHRVCDDLALRKADIWTYEDEFRFVNMGGGRIPLPYDGRALTAILVGSNFSNASEIQLRTILDERSKRGLPNVRVLRAACARETYKVTFRRQDD